jgi:hypothetical protein
MSNFNPVKCICTVCESLIVSSYPGEFVQCECGKSFVDQTHHYGRYGGPVELLSERILKDLKYITGIGYEKDDVLNLLAEQAEQHFISPLNVNALIYSQYNSTIPELGGTSPRDLVEAGRGHKVIEFLQAKKEGY